MPSSLILIVVLCRVSSSPSAYSERISSPQVEDKDWSYLCLDSNLSSLDVWLAHPIVSRIAMVTGLVLLYRRLSSTSRRGIFGTRNPVPASVLKVDKVILFLWILSLEHWSIKLLTSPNLWRRQVSTTLESKA